MKEKISKILKLNYIESFLQVNYLKGYKYIDKAGEIVNHFFIDGKEPLFEMNLGGLTILKPKEKAEEMRVTPKSLWAHFVNPGSFEEVEDFYTKELKNIATILNIKEITRIGWRHYFIYDFKTEAEADEVIGKFSPISNMKSKELYFEYICNSIPLNIRLKKVFKNDEEKTPGILVDVDFYKKFDSTVLTLDKANKEIEKLKTTAKSNDFLGLVNEILK